MQTLRLEAVVGAAEARLTPAPHPWYRHPGAYVQKERNKTTYYIVRSTETVGKNGDLKTVRVEKDEAERYALAERPAEEQIAHDVVTATASADRLSTGPGIGTLGPLPSPEFAALVDYPTALACLEACGAEFEVVPFQSSYEAPDGTTLAAGWRTIIRKDTNAVLHCATDGYEIVPQRVALSLMDKAAARGFLRYRFAWASVEQQRIRPIGAEKATMQIVRGRRVGIRFDLPSLEAKAFGGRISAGGALVTSHDGSTAIRATACLTFGGVSVFHVDTESWRHSSKVAIRLSQADEALDYLVRAAAGLIRDAEATINVPDDEAADVVLRAIAPKLFASAPAVGSMDEKDRKTLIELREKKRASCMKRLHAHAQETTSKNEDVYLGGFRYVLAAPFAFSNRAGEGSFYDGDARDRMTEALLALARHAGLAEAGMVPTVTPAAVVS